VLVSSFAQGSDEPFVPAVDEMPTHCVQLCSAQSALRDAKPVGQLGFEDSDNPFDVTCCHDYYRLICAGAEDDEPDRAAAGQEIADLEFWVAVSRSSQPTARRRTAGRVTVFKPFGRMLRRVGPQRLEEKRITQPGTGDTGKFRDRVVI
jgi:hypothetical protein